MGVLGPRPDDARMPELTDAESAVVVDLGCGSATLVSNCTSTFTLGTNQTVRRQKQRLQKLWANLQRAETAWEHLLI